MGDPRIHAAINCAARGCPPMAEKAYRSGTLDAQLQDAVADWAQSNGIVIQGNQVGLSPIFDWFGEDFTGAYGTRHFDIPGVEGEPEAGINFLVPHLDGATRTRLQAGGYETFWTTYDWAINRR